MSQNRHINGKLTTNISSHMLRVRWFFKQFSLFIDHFKTIEDLIWRLVFIKPWSCHGCTIVGALERSNKVNCFPLLLRFIWSERGLAEDEKNRRIWPQISKQTYLFWKEVANRLSVRRHAHCTGILSDHNKQMQFDCGQCVWWQLISKCVFVAVKQAFGPFVWNKAIKYILLETNKQVLLSAKLTSHRKPQ